MLFASKLRIYFEIICESQQETRCRLELAPHQTLKTSFNVSLGVKLYKSIAIYSFMSRLRADD